jgi:hypothetical protein
MRRSPSQAAKVKATKLPLPRLPRQARAHVGLTEPENLSACEAALERDPVARRLRKKILALQANLKRSVDERAWRAYLALEEVVNHREAYLLELMHACARRERKAAPRISRKQPRRR